MQANTLTLLLLAVVAVSAVNAHPVRKLLQGNNAADPAAVSEETITALYDTWNTALTQSTDAVVALYAEDAVLLPTLSNEIRTTPDRMAAYFDEDFLPKNPTGVVNESYIKVLGNVAIHNGKYDFTVTTDGVESVANARFTYVYAREGGDWKIVTHHSSLLPEPVEATDGP